MHPTATKGDIGVLKTILDLTVKGYEVYLPFNEYGKVDLIAYKDAKCIRIQVKSREDGTLPRGNATSGLKGEKSPVVVKYKEGDFDFYALYNPTIGVVVYPSIKFLGKTIAFTKPNSYTPFYWYEDFLDFTEEAEKRTCWSMGYTPIVSRIREDISYKIVWPSDEELGKMIWERPASVVAKELGVSDSAVVKRCNTRAISKPPRGYWQQKASE